MKNLSYILAIFLAIILGGCASSPDGVSQSEAKSEFSAEKVELRENIHAYVIKTFGIYSDPDLNTYIRDVGHRISNDLPYRFNFYVLDTSRVQAWAVPGGNIYITRGLLAAIQTEDELAAVLGHEVAHIMFNHSDKFRDTAKSTNELGRAIHSHAKYQHVKQLAAEFSFAVNQGYNRKQEFEADRMALRYMKSAGYDPVAVKGLLKMFLARERQDQIDADSFGLKKKYRFELYSSHPGTSKRLEAVKNIIGKKFTGTKPWRASRQRYLSKIDGTTYGDSSPFMKINRRQLLFKHPSIKLRLPKGWIALTNDKKLLMFQPKEKWVQLVFSEKIIPKRTPRETFIRNVFRVEKNRGKTLHIPGINAYTAEIMRTKGGRKAHARITLFYQGKDAIVFVGTSTDRKLPPALNHMLLRTVSSARPIKYPGRINFDPKRIRVDRIRSGDTYASLSRKIPIYYRAEERLRLLNNAGPDDELVLGQRIKLIK